MSQFQKISDADQSLTFIIKLLINMSLRVYLIKLYTVQDICLISLFILIICRHHHWEVSGKTHYGHKLLACQNIHWNYVCEFFLTDCDSDDKHSWFVKLFENTLEMWFNTPYSNLKFPNYNVQITGDYALNITVLEPYWRKLLTYQFTHTFNKV